MTCAVSPNHKLLATACKASSAEHAVVRIYDTETWKQIGQPLEGHNLTITKITFSHDNRYLLTCSRDRTWRLFRASGEGQGQSRSCRSRCHWSKTYMNDRQQVSNQLQRKSHMLGLSGTVHG